MPIPVTSAYLDSRARFELAVLGLGIPVPFHRPREIGPPPASRTLHAKIRSLCCTSGAREIIWSPSKELNLINLLTRQGIIQINVSRAWSFRGDSDPIPFVGNERAAPISESNVWLTVRVSNPTPTAYQAGACTNSATGH